METVIDSLRADDQEVYSYHIDLWDKFDLIKKASEDRRKVMSDYLSVMKEYAGIEEYYCKKMKEISGKFENITQAAG